MTTIPPYEVLRLRREAKGVQQKAMAAALGMNKSTYSRLESGFRQYYVEDAIAAAAFLGVSLAAVTVKLSASLRQAA